MRKGLCVAVTLLFGAAACQVVEIPEPDTGLTISISADPVFEDDGSPETKAVVRGNTMFWSPGDTLGVFPGSGSQVYFLAATESESESAPFDGGGWEFKTGITYRSYYPFIGSFYLNPSKIPVQFYSSKGGEIELQSQTGNDSSIHTSKYLYMFTGPEVVEGDHISFVYHHLWTILKPSAQLPSGHYTKLTFSLDDPLFVVKGYFDMTSNNPAIIGTEFENEMSMDLDITLDRPSSLIAYYATAPLDMRGKILRITITEESGNEYSYDYSPSKEYVAGMTYKLTSKDSFVIEGLSLDESILELNVYETHPLALTITPETAVNDKVIWTSSDPSVATVDDSGNVMGVAPGVATITVSTVEGDISATCDVTVTASSQPTYNKVSSITVGGTYLIVDAGDERVFNGGTQGKYDRISPKNNVIIDSDGSLSRYEFTVEKSGNNYYLKFNDGKYLVCDYSSNGSAGLAYVNAQSDVTYPYALTTGTDGAFFFSTTMVDKPANTNQVLYYKTGTGSGSDVFKIGQSGRTVGVHLYLKNGKHDRGLMFDPENVSCTLGNTPKKPILSGIYTTAVYSSSNVSVATVDANGNVSPVSAGTVTITATVAEDEQYNAGSASYTLKIRNASTSGRYVRVTSIDQINMEGEYVIVYENGQTQKAFKPVLNAGKNAFLTSSSNAVDVTITDNEIDADEVDSCRFTLANQEDAKKKFSLIVPEADGTSDYYWYVYRSGVFVAKVYSDDSTDTGYRSTFELSPDGKLTLRGHSDYLFRYSSGSFTAATGASNDLYLFVRADGQAKKRQTISFAEPTVTWTLGENCEIGQSCDYPQEVTGAETNVTYSSEPASVAKIEGGKIKIVGPGSATITATAEKTDTYYSATTSYTLRILRAPSNDWVDMGSINLENLALYDFLNDANVSYTDTNDDTYSVIDKYTAGMYASIDRKDCPNPVSISWTNAASNSTVVSIYGDESLTNLIWSQDATFGSTHADVYNLIPGLKYYYTVSEDDTIWEKGYFSTTGRRRMIKVSDMERKGHANNCRDLGGLEVMDNGTKKTIKYGYLFRGTNMDKTTDDEKAILAGFLNIGTDIDLRTGNTTGSVSNDDGSYNCYRPFSSSLYNVRYVNPGFYTFQDLTTSDKVRSVITAIFETARSGKASYFHCYIGADRTGYFAMLIEGLLGVSEKDCSIDYELTSFSDAVGEKRYRNVDSANQHFRPGITFLRGQEGDTFQEKIENYLVYTVGISKNDIEEFKSIVLKEN